MASINPTDVQLGSDVIFTVCYPRKTSERFWPEPDSQPEGRQGPVASPIPLPRTPGVGHKSGRVVGIRTVIMSGYEYRYNDDFAYANGIKENVLLVCEDIRQEPVIVRFADAQLAAPPL